MTFGNLARQIERLAADNSPVILTAIGVVGTVTTAVLSAKGATKAERILVEEARARTNLESLRKNVDSKPLVKKEQFKLVWKCYIPAASTGAMTICCIITANHIGTRRTAAMAAAYGLSEKALTEYKDKIYEKFGENKARSVRDEIAQDRVNANQPNEGNVVIIGNGNVLCCDMQTMRYFDSSVEDIKKAMNDTNYQINNYGYASVSDFYDRVGLRHTKDSDELGWNSDKLMDLEFTTTMTEDGRPCIAFSFQAHPVRNYHRQS